MNSNQVNQSKIKTMKKDQNFEKVFNRIYFHKYIIELVALAQNVYLATVNFDLELSVIK